VVDGIEFRVTCLVTLHFLFGFTMNILDS
jgi:hypothetical protein